MKSNKITERPSHKPIRSLDGDDSSGPSETTDLIRRRAIAYAFPDKAIRFAGQLVSRI